MTDDPVKAAAPPPDVRSVSKELLAAQFADWGQPAFRLDQLMRWLYPNAATRWDEMTNLPKALRERLAAAYRLEWPELVRVQGSADTTRKFLWRLADGSLIESVLIPANPALYGDPSDRHTLCVSTQVGCAYGCRFCASGLDGWKRNLQPHEIIGQVLAVERWRTSQSPSDADGATGRTRLVNNLVIMGMGEPLANYANLMTALATLNAPWGGNIGARKITISTSGLAPRIRELADDPHQYRLAISLHGATDDVRDRIMPVNRKHPLAELVQAADHYVRRKGRQITLEYILIEGVNDALDQCRPLADLAQRLRAKVNLIPYNPVDGLPWRRPSDVVCEAFADTLEEEGVTVTLRLEKGRDIDAACGQLRLKTERELATAGASSAGPALDDPSPT
jgi:23S rRNA (adenine2503-C2)-methyltransferase